MKVSELKTIYKSLLSKLECIDRAGYSDQDEAVIRLIRATESLQKLIAESDRQETIYIDMRIENDEKQPKVWDET